MPTHRPLLLAGNLVSNNAIAGVRAPWDGRMVTHVSRAGPAEAAVAATAAAGAFDQVRRMPSRRRVAILRNAAAAVARRRIELVRAICDEGGKPVRFAGEEVDHAVDVLEICAEEAERIDGAVLSRSGEHTSPQYLRRCFPRGPVLALTPFHMPLLGAAQRVGPAVAAGCPIVVRPPEQTPSAALLLGEALLEAGWPGEALSVLPCDQRVADALVTDVHFATLCFTGSTRSGWNIRARAGRKHVVWDAGEEASAIVEPDADLERAVARIAGGAFAHAGQHCASVQRVLVHTNVWDEVRDRFADASARVPCGDPALDDVVCGPLIDWSRITHLESWIAEAEERGLRRLCGGQRMGTVLTPVVIEASDPSWKAHARDAVGPIVVVERYRTLDEAIERINAGPSTQETGLFTRGLSRIWHAFDRIDSGSLVHDEYPAMRPVRPGGDGRTQTRRNRQRATIEEMTEVRTLIMRATDPNLQVAEAPPVAPQVDVRV